MASWITCVEVFFMISGLTATPAINLWAPANVLVPPGDDVDLTCNCWLSKEAIHEWRRLREDVPPFQTGFLHTLWIDPSLLYVSPLFGDLDLNNNWSNTTTVLDINRTSKELIHLPYHRTYGGKAFRKKAIHHIHSVDESDVGQYLCILYLSETHVIMQVTNLELQQQKAETQTTYFSTLANDDTTSGIEGKKTSDEPTPSQFPDWKYDYEDRGAQFLPDAIMRETNEAPLSTGNYLPALILIACLLLMVFAFAFALMIGIRSKRQSSISQCSKNYSRNNPDNSCTNSLGPLPPMVTSV